jgi:hypothetical protein
MWGIAMREESNIGHMRQLNDFHMAHLAVGGLVILHASYIDSLSCVKCSTPEAFPDQTIAIKLADAKRLLAELKKSIDYIEANIEHPS